LKSNNTTQFKGIIERYNISPETEDESGNTLINIAAQCGFVDMCKIIIKKGANVNTQNIYGCTPLHYAKAYKFSAVCDVLILNGANDRIINNEGFAPWDLKL
jgi:ankyrin repeat protein